MNVQEIETAVRLKIPIIVIVWIDDGLNLIKLKQNHEFGQSVATEFGNPDIVKLAESFGAKGFHAKTVKEFQKFLKEAKKTKDVPVIIGVDLDYSRNPILLDDDYQPYVESLENKSKK